MLDVEVLGGHCPGRTFSVWEDIWNVSLEEPRRDFSRDNKRLRTLSEPFLRLFQWYRSEFAQGRNFFSFSFFFQASVAGPHRPSTPNRIGPLCSDLRFKTELHTGTCASVRGHQLAYMFSNTEGMWKENSVFRDTSFRTRSEICSEINRDYPLNLSISLSGGKETNQDPPCPLVMMNDQEEFKFESSC